MSKHTTANDTLGFLLIQYRTSHTKVDGSLAFHQYYLEETDPNEPVIEVTRRAVSSPEGDHWRLVTWDGDIHTEVSPLTSWQPTIHYKGE